MNAIDYASLDLLTVKDLEVQKNLIDSLSEISTGSRLQIVNRTEYIIKIDNRYIPSVSRKLSGDSRKQTLEPINEIFEKLLISLRCNELIVEESKNSIGSLVNDELSMRISRFIPQNNKEFIFKAPLAISGVMELRNFYQKESDQETADLFNRLLTRDNRLIPEHMNDHDFSPPGGLLSCLFTNDDREVQTALLNALTVISKGEKIQIKDPSRFDIVVEERYVQWLRRSFSGDGWKATAEIINKVFEKCYIQVVRAKIFFSAHQQSLLKREISGLDFQPEIQFQIRWTTAMETTIPVALEGIQKFQNLYKIDKDLDAEKGFKTLFQRMELFCKLPLKELNEIRRTYFFPNN